MSKFTYDAGVRKASQILGPEGLGRLGTDQEVQEGLKMKKAGIEDQKKVTERQRALTSKYGQMADEGISLDAREAMRTKMAQQMGAAQQAAGLRMGAALGGARGASAAAQQRSLMAQGMMGRANIERDIFLEAEKAKERGMAGMQASLSGESASLAQERAATGAYTSALGEVKTFDIGQAAAEKELRASMGMQYEQLAQADRAAELAAQAQRDAANAQGKK